MRCAATVSRSQENLAVGTVILSSALMTKSCMVCNDLCELTSGLPTYCGDGIVQGDVGEACDEGDGRNGNDLCSTSCELVTWVHIEAGSFTMGSSADEVGHQSNESQREVTLTRGYYMMAHEVTQQQWEERMGYNPALHGSNDCDSCPVDSVNWWEALMYANRLSESEGYEPCYVLEAARGLHRRFLAMRPQYRALDRRR